MRIQFAVFALLVLFTTSCIDNANIVFTPGGSQVDVTDLVVGATRVYVTATGTPPNNVAALTVVAQDLGFNTSPSAPVNDSSWVDSPVVPANTFELVGLSQGFDEIANDQIVPAGTYKQLRMTLNDAGVILTDSSTAALNLTNGQAAFDINATFVAGVTYGIIVNIDYSNLAFANSAWGMTPVYTVVEVFSINDDGTTTAVTQ